MNELKVPIDRVQPHRYFAANKKLCPRNILKSEKTWQADWKAFQSRIQSAKNAQDKPTKDTTVNMPAYSSKPASTNSDGVARVGDIVYFKGGSHYNTANARKKANLLSRKASNAKITHISKGSKYPYHLVHTGKGNVYGWVAEKDIEFSKTNATAKPTIGIKKGDKVKVKKNAKTFTGGNLASFVYNQTYDVIQVNGNRIVIGKGKVVTAAINKKDLTKA